MEQPTRTQNGVDGICVFGSTGGNGSFTDDEMKKTTAPAGQARWRTHRGDRWHWSANEPWAE
jgi:hypothetical protein